MDRQKNLDAAWKKHYLRQRPEQAFEICSGFTGKRRQPADLAALDASLAAITDRYKVITVRQLFYQATVRGLVAKTEDGYNLVQRRCTEMRKSGFIEYSKFADSTRWQRKPNTHSDLSSALTGLRNSYRRDLWQDGDTYIEVFLEKDALASVLYPVTYEWDVPLMVTRGFSSLTFLFGAAEEMKRQRALGKDCHILTMYDFDASGQIAGQKVGETISELAGFEVQVSNLAVTLDQIRDMNLQTRDAKKADFQKGWKHDFSCELDAIDPDQLQKILTDAIEDLADHDHLDTVRAIEEAEQEALDEFVANFRSA